MGIDQKIYYVLVDENKLDLVDVEEVNKMAEELHIHGNKNRFGRIYQQELLSVDENKILECARKLYEKAKNQGHISGPFGDILELKVIKEEAGYALIVDIYELAFRKPGLAADLGFFIKTPEKIYLLTGVRKTFPGKGKPVIFGGFLNCWEVLDSPKYTALNESDEFGLEFELEFGIEYYREDLSTDPLEVVIKNFGEPIKTKLYYVGEVNTSEEERLPDGSKRVYKTTGYVLPVQLDRDLSEDEILKKFTAKKDEIMKLQLFDVSDDVKNNKTSKKSPRFAVEHQNKLYEMMISVINKVFYGDA